MSTPEYLFWLDLETTGLNPKLDLILEVAVVVTDTDFEEVDRFHRVIGKGWRGLFPVEMDDVVKAMHENSGLLKDLGESGHHWSTVGNDLKQLADRYHGAYLAGSGVHFDRGFIAAQWRHALKSLHYRNLDVSTIRTFVNLWHPRAAYKPAKAHRAMADVEDAIAEARYYSTQLRVDDSWAAGVLRQKAAK